jgi:hypothetical protein
MALVADVLPESRARRSTGAVWRPDGWWVPFACASCGKECGLCPDDNTFMFYLCPGCAEKYGEIAGLYMMPDQVFWERVRVAQLEKHGRLLASHELAAALDDPTHPLTRLLKERVRELASR